MSVETNRRLEAYVEAVPKIELHVHIEGTLESAQMYCIGQRNQIRLDDTPETHRKIRVGGGGETVETRCSEACIVLREQQDFYDLMYAYLKRAAIDNVYAAEIFFDPYLHTRRDVPIHAVLQGFRNAIVDGYNHFSIRGALIMHISHLSPRGCSPADVGRGRTYIVGVAVDSNYPRAGYLSIYKKVNELGGLKIATHFTASQENSSCAPHEYAAHGFYVCYTEENDPLLQSHGYPVNINPLTSRSSEALKRHLESGDAEVTASKMAALTEKDVHTLCCNALRSSFLTLQERENYLQHVRHTNVAMGCTGYFGIMEATSKAQLKREMARLVGMAGTRREVAWVYCHLGSTLIAPLFGNEYNSHNVIARSLLDRFWMYLRDSEYFIAFGGTIGTITEILVVWSVASARVSHRGIPQKILLWRPHWESAIENLAKAIGISSLDTSLLIYVDSVQEAVKIIEQDLLTRTASATL
eukprot:Em0631g2a